MARPSRQSFYQVISAAIADLIEHGFDSQQRLDDWLRKIETAARAALVPESVLQAEVRDLLERTYQRTVEGRGLMRAHTGVSQFTLINIKPRLRAELDRRILASANLIKLNREASVQRTLQRFAGWATSIPAGGTNATEKQEVAAQVRRSIAGLPYAERLVVHDQGHKLAAAINDIVSRDGGAIAGLWRHVREGGGYQARPEHVARDGKIYLIRESWAKLERLVKPGPDGYTDQITAPAEEIGCRCRYVYLYNLRDLPANMLTEKGKQALEARAAVAKFA